MCILMVKRLAVSFNSFLSLQSFFCRLDFFLISDNILNSIVSSNHYIVFKSDHSLVSVNIDLLNLTRGPGYFRLNNSLLLDKEYQGIVKYNRNFINK